jgi:hypothetical protein
MHRNIRLGVIATGPAQFMLGLEEVGDSPQADHLLQLASELVRLVYVSLPPVKRTQVKDDERR